MASPSRQDLPLEISEMTLPVTFIRNLSISRLCYIHIYELPFKNNRHPALSMQSSLILEKYAAYFWPLECDSVPDG